MGWAERAEQRWRERLGPRDVASEPGSGLVVLTHGVHIRRSAQAVWDLVTDADVQPVLSPDVRRAEPVAGTGPGVGQQTAITRVLHGVPVFTVSEVTAWHPPRYAALVSRASAGPPQQTQLWVDPTGAGCLARWQTGVLVPANTPVAQRDHLLEHVRSDLEILAGRLTRLAETGSPD